MFLLDNICIHVEESVLGKGPDLGFVIVSWQDDSCKVIKIVGGTRVVDCYNEFALILLIIYWAV